MLDQARLCFSPVWRCNGFNV